MRSLARQHRRLELVPGTAESLPFAAASFDLVFSVNVIHHVRDTLAYFLEAMRVIAPGGRLCTVTDTTEMIRNRRPLSVYWPSSAEADISRYPTVDRRCSQMQTAGFAVPTTRDVRARFAVTDPAPYRDRAFSCLHMISDAEFAEGLARLEGDLDESPVEGLSESVCLWGETL